MFIRVMKKDSLDQLNVWLNLVFLYLSVSLAPPLPPLSFCPILTHHLLLCHSIPPSSEDFNSWMNSATVVLLLSSVLVSVQGFAFTQKDGLWLSNFVNGSPKISQGSYSLRNIGGTQGLGPC